MVNGSIISSAFKVWQDTGDGEKGRFVVNLSKQSQHLAKGSVRMESLSQFGMEVQRGDHFVSMDFLQGVQTFSLGPSNEGLVYFPVGRPILPVHCFTLRLGAFPVVVHPVCRAFRWRDAIPWIPCPGICTRFFDRSITFWGRRNITALPRRCPGYFDAPGGPWSSAAPEEGRLERFPKHRASGCSDRQRGNALSYRSPKADESTVACTTNSERRSLQEAMGLCQESGSLLRYLRFVDDRNAVGTLFHGVS